MVIGDKLLCKKEFYSYHIGNYYTIRHIDDHFVRFKGSNGEYIGFTFFLGIEAGIDWYIYDFFTQKRKKENLNWKGCNVYR